MNQHQHLYKSKLEWKGNTGKGTSDYRSYSRDNTITFEGKPELLCSADPVFRGDSKKYNPEELLVASLSQCHLLTYLHLCAINGVVVLEYSDNAEGILMLENDGGGKFTEVTLNPVVIVKDKYMIERAAELHEEAAGKCFIANSCNFPIHHKPVCKVKDKIVIRKSLEANK